MASLRNRGQRLFPIRLKIDKMFTRLLTGFPGNNNFILTVTENNGLSTTKTLKYYVPAN